MNKNKTSTAIALFLMFAMAFSLVTLPLANAHDPPWQIPTFAFINVAPDPVGVGQTVAVVMWLDKMPDGTAVGNDIRFHNYKLTITKPDGTTETKTWDVVWDATSSQYTPYTPDQAGTYTFKFEFPGQKYTWTDPIPSMFGGPGAPSAYINDTYLASSATTTITVQEEPVAAYISAYPLPTEYWTRPIEGQNTAWVSIASNYLDPVKYGTAYSFGSIRLQPDGAAPDSPHIMWTKPIQFGGVVGGSNTGVDAATFYTGLSYESRFSKPIIIYGKLYYSLPKSDSISGGFFPAPGGGYVCVDLRTGEQLWWQNYTVNPTFAQLEWFDSPNQHGVISNGYLWAVSGTTWSAYDPLDGNWLFTITDVPSGTREYGPNGELVIYQLDAANNWLALWNITQVITGGAGGAVIWTEGYRPVGKVFNSTERDAYSWNVTISGLPSGSAIGWAIDDNVILGTAGTYGRFPSLGGVGTGTSASYATFWAMSLKSESRGQLMWIKNFSAPAGNITRQLGPIDIENRVFAMSDKETMQWSGYDLDSGDHLWGPVGETRAFNYYPTVGSGGVSQVGFVAYGKLYTGGYGGELFCYDTKNGTLLWKYNNTYCGFETPWGLYPVFPAAIADDKIYIYSGEHSPNAPPYKGSRVRCLNATTGEELWTMLGWAGVGDFSDEGWPVADGYIAYLNAYDMQVYCLGKGPSATSVSIQNDVTTHGNKVLVKGSVIDIAAGTNQAEPAARFPNGVPAVSDESMGEWMEYVYMQKPRPANATGVEVVLEVLDPNENYYEVGRTTSDASGMFSCVFTPEVPGKYTVIATFEGSESYYGSHAETALFVEDAPTPTPEPTPIPASIADMYLVPGIIGIIVAIAVVGAIIVLMLRKR